MNLQGKTAFIAGATSGLGLGVARHFAERRAHVVLVGRRREFAEMFTGELGELGGNALGLGADITDPDQVAAAINATLDRFGTLDINVNTAAYIAAVPLTEADGTPADPAEFTRMVTTNLVGTFNVMSQAAAAMLNNVPDDEGERGVIINTSSAAAHDGTIGMVGYSATKAALAGMTLPAAREFGPWHPRQHHRRRRLRHTDLRRLHRRRGHRPAGPALRRPPPPGQTRRVRRVRRPHRGERLLQRLQPTPGRRVSHTPRLLIDQCVVASAALLDTSGRTSTRIRAGASTKCAR
ncbi:SDR family NAD(P)-dependent oxidoreductase [Streptomyces sp. NPDC086549]|uniref:SDR family NAD(P)-dependent oxidoreductase n=1 Tax=Streptomyces sp. NPDC086549 TaxID=3365752 RepID=UPI0037FA41FE